MRAQTISLLLALAACGGDDSDSDDNTPVTPDAPSTVTPDAPPVLVDADLGPGETLKVVPVSATGHDHLFGVAYNAQGSIFATGQTADATDATTDYSALVVKFTAAGELDTTFGTGGIFKTNLATGTNGELCRSIVVQSTGKPVVACSIEHAGATDVRDRDIALVRLTTAGALDSTFGTNGVVTLDLSTGIVSGNSFLADSVWGLVAYADDRLVVTGGKVRAGAEDTDYVVVRLSANGVPDAAFGTNGVFSLDLQIPDATNGNALKHNNASPRNVALLPGTGGIIAAGYQPVPGRDTEPVVYKLTDAGQLDTTFGTAGVFSDYLLDEQAETYVAKPQGAKLVTTGYGRDTAAQTTDILSLRLNANGTLDTTWGTNGMVRIDVGGFADNSRNLLVLPDNRVLLLGGGRPTADNVDGFVGVLEENGAPDTSFAPNGWKTIELGGVADFLWSAAVSPTTPTIAFVGIKGVGTAPAAGANDDSVLYLLPVPQ